MSEDDLMSSADGNVCRLLDLVLAFQAAEGLAGLVQTRAGVEEVDQPFDAGRVIDAALQVVTEQ